MNDTDNNSVKTDVNEAIVTDDHHVAFYELLDNYYRCPNCNYDVIIEEFKYCPKCGVRLRWNINVP